MKATGKGIVLSLVLLGIPLWGSGSEETAPAPGTMDRIEEIAGKAEQLAERWAARFGQWDSEKDRSRTYMGVVVESVPEVLRDYIELPKGVGLLLSHITEGGPAAEAGLKANDILVQFNDQWIINLDQLSTLIDLKGPGSVVEVEVLRKGEPVRVKIELEAKSSGKKDGGGSGEDFAPGFLDSLNPDELGIQTDEMDKWMEKLEEWMPGSVRVFIDENEQVHVDLTDLKENMGDLRRKLKHLGSDLDSVGAPLVWEHGDEGARKTVVRMQDRDLSYAGPLGKVEVKGSAEGNVMMIWDAEGQLLYEGPFPVDSEESLPEEAVVLLAEVDQLRDKVEAEEWDGEGIEVELSGNRREDFAQ